MRITDMLARGALSDGKLTDEEWSAMETTLRLGRARASEAARLLVKAVFTQDMTEATRNDVADYLRTRGYNVPLAPKKAQNPAIGEKKAKTAIKSNVTEVDLTFYDLMRRAGRDTQAGMSVGIIDGGFEGTHAALKGKQLPGHDFVDGDDVVTGEDHGSHVAGVATKGTDLIYYRPVVGFKGTTSAIDKVCGEIEEAIKGGARVINMSFKVDDKSETDKVKAMLKKYPNVIFVKSAGNDGKPIGADKFAPDVFLPANDFPNMIVVGNATGMNGVSPSSNTHGTFVTVAANGTDILSSVNGNKYDAMTGTSMATPAVTNVVAKMLLLDPQMTPEQVKRILVETSVAAPEWKGKNLANGVIDEDKAMKMAAYIGLRRRGVSEWAASRRIDMTPSEVSVANRLMK